MKYKFNQFQPKFSPEGDGGAGGGGGGAGNAGEGGAGGGAPTPILNEDLSFADGFQERVGEHAAGMTFKTLPDVFKSVKEGTATITRLNQELAELKKAGGNTPPQLPADAAGYLAAIKLPDKMPDGVILPEGMLDAAAAYALENKIPPEVTNKFVQFQIEQAAKEFASFKDMEFAAVNKAKAEISAAVGPQNYDQTIADAKAAHDLLGLNLSAEDLIQNVTLVTSLAKMHAKLAPGTLRELGIGKDGQTAESKLTQANDILNNTANPHYAAFYDQSHPNHQIAMDHYNRLILESGGDGNN